MYTSDGKIPEQDVYVRMDLWIRSETFLGNRVPSRVLEFGECVSSGNRLGEEPREFWGNDRARLLTEYIIRMEFRHVEICLKYFRQDFVPHFERGVGLRSATRLLNSGLESCACDRRIETCITMIQQIRDCGWRNEKAKPWLQLSFKSVGKEEHAESLPLKV